MTAAERDAQVADLRRKLEKRRDVPGFAANVRDIEAKLAELEAMTFEPPPEPEPEPTPNDGEDPGGVPLPVGDEG